MKSLATAILFSATLLLQSQTPARKTAPAKPSATPHSAAAAARPSLLNPASLKAKAPAVFQAKFSTTAGDFTVEVHRDWAPLGADRFYNLVRNGYFTNAAFFRVVKGFVVQFGLSGNPAYNKVWTVAKIQDDPVKQSNKRGYPRLRHRRTQHPHHPVLHQLCRQSPPRRHGLRSLRHRRSRHGRSRQNLPRLPEKPEQDQITTQGDAYLKANFPMIDKIKLARILPATPPTAAAAKPAAKPTTAKPATKPAAH